MIEGSWLCLVLVLPNLKRLEEDGFHLQKLLKHFLPGICYKLNLPNGFQYSARYQLTARLKISQLTVKKSCYNTKRRNARRLNGSKSAKMTTLLSRFKNVIFRHHHIIQTSSSIETEQS